MGFDMEIGNNFENANLQIWKVNPAFIHVATKVFLMLF